jgi:hypothetical protein
MQCNSFYEHYSEVWKEWEGDFVARKRSRVKGKGVRNEVKEIWLPAPDYHAGQAALE